MREIFRTLAVLSLVAVVLGCRGQSFGPTGRVSGKLTMDGKPLPAGHAVSFMQMEKGFLAYGTTDAEGNFQVNSWNNGEMPVGSYDVMIAPPAGTDPAEDPNLSAEERFEKSATGAAPRQKILLPMKYRQTTTSGLKYDIKDGDNHFDIDLKSK